MEFGEFRSLGQEPNNSVYLAPFKYISTHESFVSQYLILCSNCGEDHASGQFPNCSAKWETERVNISTHESFVSQYQLSISNNIIQRIQIKINTFFRNLWITFPVRREEDRDPGNPAPRSTLQNRLAVFWEFRSLEIPGRPLVPNRSEVLLSIVGNFGEFQEFHWRRSCSSQYARMTASAILAGIINKTRKCSILILFLYPLLNIRIQEAPVKSPGQIFISPFSAILQTVK